MKVSLDWIRDFVDISASPDEVAARLTMAGLEIEGTESVEGDVVFEVNVTPNRPDCLSILGIAREVAAAVRLPMKLPNFTIEDGPDSEIGVEIIDSDLCNRYTGRMIKGVKITPTPTWISRRLEKCGVRPLNNNIVDITNYVLLELGHPLHAFDSDKLADKVIRVARAGHGRQLLTLDGVERKVPESSLLIWDGREPVAVAGVMGGEVSGVTGTTVNVFLESAYFEPSSIRRTSKALGLKSESSYRFERGTDIEFLVSALNRAALLMRETGGGVISKIVDIYPIKYVPVSVDVRYEKVNKLIGAEIEKKQMLELLSGIGIKTEDRGDNFLAFPPPYRRDIQHYVDIVEEVARTYGFGNIPVKVPSTPLPAGIIDRHTANLNALRDAIRKSGFNEVINYSFMDSASLDMLDIAASDPRRKCVEVKNPLRPEDALMRTTLVPELINNFLYNLSRGMGDIRLYELSRVFIDEGGQLPYEGKRLSGIFYSDKSPSLWKEDAPSFYVVKGVVENSFEELGIEGIRYVPSSEVFLHPGKSADIIFGGKKVGFLGELGPAIAERLDLKIKKPEIVVFELDADVIAGLPKEKTAYCPIPRYPAVGRDIAMIISDALTSQELMDLVRSYDSALIERVELFDIFKGGNIPACKKSLAFRIIYRAKDRTLTDAEVEAVHEGLVEFLLKKTGGEIRGK